MLARLDRFESKLTLIQNSGIQFLDFGLTLDPRRERPGQFVPGLDQASLERLVYDVQRGLTHLPGQPGREISARLEVAMAESLKLFDALWLPLPLLRLHPPRKLDKGPETWARMRLAALNDSERDPGGHTHRLTLALDTSVLSDDPRRRYLAPTLSDVQTGVSFALAPGGEHLGWFPALPWVDGWLRESFAETAPEALKLAPEDLAGAQASFIHHAHYLNLLALVSTKVQIPQIQLLGDHRETGRPNPALAVDLVLDIGNSRSFGILIEQHPKELDGLKWRYELELRDLSRSHQVYSEPFESRVELVQGAFGKEHWAAKSGRGGAFQWPTIGRVGPEAARLAGTRRGSGGATGISSPKRYLWDTERFQTGWHFNNAYVRSQIEPKAVAPPMSMLIDETGRALFFLEEHERLPVFRPHYSRSAMMTFMLAEVFAHALCQINSAGQRLRMPNADLPRHLRTVILTVPPSMPKEERDLFEQRVREALGILWKALRWHPEDDPIDGEGAKSAWPPLPSIEVSWDEATCGQIVYLYNESQNHYRGRTDEFFASAARPGADGPQRRLTIASVDIGGGTTDLVINDYFYEPKGLGQSAYIEPEQRFRDGFRIAGDDILLQVIQTVLIPAIAKAFRQLGLSDTQPLLAKMLGTERLDVRDTALRQQLVVQLLYPAGLALLKRYENYDPFQGEAVETQPLGQLAREGEGPDPSPRVLDFVRQLAVQEGGARMADFALPATEIRVDLSRLHQLFLGGQFELGRSIRSLCEVVYHYGCDILLLTGRPSRLPGIQFLFRSLLPLPPDRILPLHSYHTGSWYPFNRRGCIGDPKTTAAVGAMLCMLGQGRLPRFFLRSKAFRPYSTIRHLGVMDNEMIIKEGDLIYRDLRLDEADYELPDVAFPVLGLTRIGFRQLPVERWAASPLYQLEVRREQILQGIYSDGTRLMVWLQRCPGEGREESLQVHRVEREDGHSVGREAVRLQLNTLTTIGLHEDNYWLDSGGVYK